MELKQELAAMVSVTALGFNRTFMELKRQTLTRSVLGRKGFNRTFMELKHCEQLISNKPHLF